MVNFQDDELPRWLAFPSSPDLRQKAGSLKQRPGLALIFFPSGLWPGGAVWGQGPHTSSLLCVTAGWGYGGPFPTSFSHLAILKNLSWNSQQGRETPCAQETQTLPKCAAGQRLRRRTYFQQGSQDTLLLFSPTEGRWDIRQAF